MTDLGDVRSSVDVVPRKVGGQRSNVDVGAGKGRNNAFSRGVSLHDLKFARARLCGDGNNCHHSQCGNKEGGLHAEWVS